MEEIIRLCDNGEYEKALKLIAVKESKDDVDSELYRIKGQIYFSQGQIDQAIDTLISSLNLDKRNEHALILIGNIYALQKKDPDTAWTYFEQVLKLNSKNFIGLNNIGAILGKQGKVEEAELFFRKVLSINDRYPHAWYGLALIKDREGLLTEAFDAALQAAQTSKEIKQKGEKEDVHKRSIALMKVLAESYLKEHTFEELITPYLKETESLVGKPITIEVSPKLNTPAKIKVAEYYNLDVHTILLKEETAINAYYVWHELTHLRLIAEARTTGDNEIFLSGEEHYEAFTRRMDKYKNVLIKNHIPESSHADYYKMSFDGLLSQLYNAPIDLFIEDRLYSSREMRPVQLLGLLEMIQPAMSAATSPLIKKISPPFVRNANITMTCTHLMQIKEFYTLDFSKDIKEGQLISKAEALYEQFTEMRHDKQPGEEYDLIRWWSEDLKLDKYFELRKEEPLSQPNSLDSFIAQLEADPYSLDAVSTYEDKQMAEFLASQRGKDINMAVLYNMVDALSYFATISPQKIKDIGFEIAMLGRSGIDPSSGDTYALTHVPDKSFSGWRLLSWMYVSWMSFDQDAAKEFGLPYEKEYAAAKKLV